MAGEPAFSDQPVVPLAAVYNYWKEFDLEALRGKLDEKGMAIAESQESSVKSRKQLAEKTKEFKRSVPPELFKQLGPLLKAYQEEVDSLTTRAKLGEGAFLEVFKRVYEAPDPTPAIAEGLEIKSRAADLEAQTAKTAQELAEYKAESKELKNQDLTIRRLEEKIRSLEGDVAAKENEVEAARRAAAAELEARSVDEARAREERLEAELGRAEAALEAMRRMHQSTQGQLFSMQEKGQEAAEAARAEAELAAIEVERAQERLALLARERDALLEKVGREENGGGGGAAGGGAHEDADTAAVVAMREELRTQRDVTTRLQSELAAASRSAENAGTAAATKIAGLQASLQATEVHAAALEAELAGRPTRQELEEARQQIRELGAVVHNALGEDFNTDARGGDGHAVGSLESALLAKNRHLEHKLTMVRLESAEAQAAAEAATSKLATVEAELERQKALVARLEEDFVAAERTTLPAGGGGGGEASSDALGGLEAEDSETRVLARTFSDENGQAMVSALSGQRDRLRARVAELEAAAAAAVAAVAQSKQDVAAARADNLVLVEQLRYVKNAYAGGGASAVPRASAADPEAGSLVVGRYMKEYDERLNPLSDFRSREREARRKGMPLQERAAFALGSALVSGSKVARSAILFYALALHLIAFLVLAGFSHHQADKVDALDEMCAKLHPQIMGADALAAAAAAGGGNGLGGLSGGSILDHVDPVVGGAVASVVKKTVERGMHRGMEALRRRMF